MATLNGRLTPRDFLLLNDLGTVTVLSFEAIRRRYFPDDTTGKSCQRRLRILEKPDFIAPVAITACFGPDTNRHRVYRLTPRGADLVAQQHGQAVRVLHTDPKPETLLHRVLVARTALAFNDASRAASLTAPLWLLENDRWPNAPRNVTEPRQYRLAFDYLGVQTVPGRPIERYAAPVYDDPAVRLVKARPDLACLLMLPGNDRPICLLMEVDNGTETHRQLLAKLPGYHAVLTRNGFVSPWQDLCDATPHAGRVLFIFESEERLQNVLDRLNEDPTVLWTKPAGSLPTKDDRERAGAFLEQSMRFGTLADLEQTAAFNQPHWSTLQRRDKDKRLAMLPSKAVAHQSR